MLEWLAANVCEYRCGYCSVCDSGSCDPVVAQG